MKASEIFAQAAEVAFLEKSCGCYALEQVCQQGYMRGQIFDKFADVFGPTNKTAIQIGGWWGDCDDKENQNARLLALCFMAAIAEDEERARKRSPR